MPAVRFATYDWFEFGRDESLGAIECIREDYPDWSTQHGACRRCVELYVSRATPRA